MQIVINISKKKYNEIKERTIITYGDGFVRDLIRRIRNGIPLPEHHGRLIDADDLREDFKTSKKISFVERMDISCIVDHAPTIIEGSENV